MMSRGSLVADMTGSMSGTLSQSSSVAGIMGSVSRALTGMTSCSSSAAEEEAGVSSSVFRALRVDTGRVTR